MTDGLLENIIQLEKQIQAEVAEEQERAKTWQERELAQLDQKLETARANEEERCRQTLTEQNTAVHQDVAKIKAETDAWCKRLAELDDATLSRVLKRKLAAILPGGDHDHPHGQS